MAEEEDIYSSEDGAAVASTHRSATATPSTTTGTPTSRPTTCWPTRPSTIATGAATGARARTPTCPASARPRCSTTSARHGHVLTPGRYVGAEAAEDDGEPCEAKMNRLTATLHQQQEETAQLDAVIVATLKELGYGQQ